MAAASIGVGGECGYGVVNYSHGTMVSAWSQVHTTQPVNWMDTGMNGQDTSNPPQSTRDQLWRNGAASYQTWRGVGNDNYVYASTSQDFKWFWESVHYHFQAYDSVQFTYGGPWYWRNASCSIDYQA
jgi:hypothetical protein